MGALRNFVYQRLSSKKKVLLLVLNATLDLCLPIADAVFWQGHAIYFSEMLHLGSAFFPFCPTQLWGKTEHVLSEWDFQKLLCRSLVRLQTYF